MNCPSCEKPVEPKWKLCPYCETKLELRCWCGLAVRSDWRRCPECGISLMTHPPSKLARRVANFFYILLVLSFMGLLFAGFYTFLVFEGWDTNFRPLLISIAVFVGSLIGFGYTAPPVQDM